MDQQDICICNGTGEGTLVRCTCCHTLYHCSCVGIPEEKAKKMDGFICDFCSFEDDENEKEEEEYVIESHEGQHKRRFHCDPNYFTSLTRDLDGFGSAVEELDENSILKAISGIEQELLEEDKSPSIHDTVQKKVHDPKKTENDYNTVMSTYYEYKSLCNDLKKRNCLHRLVKIKEMCSSKVDDNVNNYTSDLTDEMKHCISILCNYDPPMHCVPLNADIRTFNWEALGKKQKELTGRYFDVISMDPPWQLATANPTRGVAIAYEQLEDDIIRTIPLDVIQTDGYLFLWVINAKYRVALDLLNYWGYTFVDEIAWVKCNRNRRMAKSHGFYLQHSKETCFVAKKGNPPPLTNFGVEPDVIYSERLGQSQKPIDTYEMIERLVPNGYYLEIFGRRNNLRDNWVTVGNEL